MFYPKFLFLFLLFYFILFFLCKTCFYLKWCVKKKKYLKNPPKKIVYETVNFDLTKLTKQIKNF